MLKKALVVAAVLAVGGATPTANADHWTEGGASFAGAAHLEGTATVAVISSGMWTSCDVTGALSLTNSGVAPLGQASGQILGGAAQNCTASLPNCVQSVAYTGSPRTITTTGADVTISGISYDTSYGGGPVCPLNGVVLPSSGAVTGEVPSASNVIEFVGATGISTYFGPAALSGAVEVYAKDGNGDPDYSRPIELSP